MFKTLHASYQPMNVIYEENGNQLWLGDFQAAQDKATLDKKGIKTVLTVASYLNIKYNDPNMNHKIYQILDSEQANIAALFDDTFNLIKIGLKCGSVLVHCAAGVSRSASIVIAYLMRNNGMNYSDAFALVKNKRFVICPNHGFQRQLRNFEKQLEQIKDDKKSNIRESVEKYGNESIKKSLPVNVENQEIKNPIQQQASPTQKVELRKTFQDLNLQQQSKNDQKIETKQNFKQNKNPMLTTKFNNTRTNLQQNKLNLQTLQTTYNSSYAGPQIVTHAKNKLFDKQPMQNLPGITAKSNLINHTMNNKRNY